MKLRNISQCLKLSPSDFFHLLFHFPIYVYRMATHATYVEKRIHDYKMLFNMTDPGITKELMLLGSREKEHIRILENELKDGMAVLDIGANIGYYSIMMGKRVGREGVVYAVEPSEANLHLLNINLRLNRLHDIVRAYPLGISNVTGLADFYESEKSNWHTFYPHVHSGTSSASLAHKNPLSVPVMTIRDFIQDKRPIDLIRMDIEGFEVEVFDGMIPLLDEADFKAKILFEVHQPRYDDKAHNMRSRLRKLFDKGYYAKIMASNLHEQGGSKVFSDRGYKPAEVVKTDFMKRGLYYNVSDDDAIEMICGTDFVRTVLLERKI